MVHTAAPALQRKFLNDKLNVRLSANENVKARERRTGIDEESKRVGGEG